MKCISFEDNNNDRHTAQLTKIVIMLITESSRFILSQTDLSVKVKGQTNKSRQIDKRTGTDRETRNTFTDFIRRCKVAHK